MKILIGYDGSKSADSALDDLQRAGLPGDIEALLLSVAEIWMPPPSNGNDPEEYIPEVGQDWLERHRKVRQSALSETQSLCRYANEILQRKFPQWKIHSETIAGSPARKILEKAEEIHPDLIITGAQGRNAISRLFLGSIAGKILSQAKCSVRVARGGKVITPASPARLIIGYDGSPGAEAAVEAVAVRNWGENSEVRLITAIDPIVPDSIGRFMTPSIIWVEEEIQTGRRWIEKLAHRALLKLEAADLKTELCVRDENPKQILIDEANNWNADCIFLGGNSCSSGNDASVLGSISAAIAERASCSVEIVKSIKS